MQSTSTLKDWPFTHRLQTLTALPRGHGVDRLGQGHKPGVGLLASMRISGPGHLQDSAQGGGECEGAGHCTFQLGPPGGITWIDHSTASLAPLGNPGQVLTSVAPGALVGFWGMARKNICKALARTGAQRRPLTAGSLQSLTSPILYL